VAAAGKYCFKKRKCIAQKKTGKNKKTQERKSRKPSGSFDGIGVNHTVSTSERL